MLAEERITVNQKVIKNAKHPLGAEDSVKVDERPRREPQRRTQSPLDVVYEDDDILIVNKPPGLLTSTVPREPRPTLVSAVWEYVRSREPRARVGLIHRLDRDAGGLLIFSKNDAAYASLKRQFFNHRVHREYLAVVNGIPDPPRGRIESRLVERTDGTVHSTKQAGKGEPAITDYELLSTIAASSAPSGQSKGAAHARDKAAKGSQPCSLLRVVLQTGRKHQIRVHLSERGLPIVGDKVYGPPTQEPRLLLAAVRLKIEHPRTGKPMDFQLPPPPFFPSFKQESRL